MLDNDNKTNLMQSTIYNYFSEHHGVVNDRKKITLKLIIA